MFECGDSLICDSATEYCDSFLGGATTDGIPGYSCAALPSECTGVNRTCECILSVFPEVSTCDEEADGVLRVHTDGV